MLRAILFNLVTFFSTGLYSILTTIAGLVGYRPHDIFFRLLKGWSASILWAAGVRMRLKGVENVKPTQYYVVVSNHQSHLDIPILINQMPEPVTFIAKKELFNIPIFNLAMRAMGVIKIDRKNRGRSRKALQEAGRVMEEKQLSVLAFPEGTRSEDGRLKSFKKGAFVLAIHAQLPILPVSIDGAFPILPKGKLTVNPGEVRMTIHPPVDVSQYQYENRDELIEKIHHIIASGLTDHGKSIQELDYSQPSFG